MAAPAFLLAIGNFMRAAWPNAWPPPLTGLTVHVSFYLLTLAWSQGVPGVGGPAIDHYTIYTDTEGDSYSWTALATVTTLNFVGADHDYYLPTGSPYPVHFRVVAAYATGETGHIEDASDLTMTPVGIYWDPSGDGWTWI